MKVLITFSVSIFMQPDFFVVREIIYINLRGLLKMSKERKLTPIAAALGATFAVSLMASPITQAAANPFTMTDHGAGYMVAEGNCGDKKGEGSCGDKKGEGSYGDKKGEGSCGDKKAEGSYGDKKAEGKCGEAKCGDKKEKIKEEGKCGEGKCGDKK